MNEPVETRSHEHERSGAAPWVFGGVLIVVGVFLLVQNVTGFDLGNWWALFILILAFGALGNAWRQYQVAGRINEPVRSSLVGGVILLFVFAVFFFGFNWGLLWPVLLILAGAGALLGVFSRD